MLFQNSTALRRGWIQGIRGEGDGGWVGGTSVGVFGPLDACHTQHHEAVGALVLLQYAAQDGGVAPPQLPLIPVNL